MRVLVCTDTYTHQTNGVVAVLGTLVAGVRRLGHEVRVLAPSDGRRSRRSGDDRLVRSVPAPYYPGERLCLARWDPLLDELVSWRPDLVHVHTEGMVGRMGVRLAKAAGAPLVVTSHTDFYRFAFGRLHASPPARLAAKAFGRGLYPHADAIVVPSEKARRAYWLQQYADRVTVIPGGICLEQFQRPMSRGDRGALLRQHGLEDGGCTLVMVTRVSREKNIAEILRHFPSLLRAVPGAQLLVVGDGPYRRRLEGQCARSGISERVRFVGGVDHADVYRYYKLGDAFVSASTFETQGMTYLEALACGLPLVCRRDACLEGVLDDGENGFLYEDRQGYVDAVSRVLLDKGLRAAMGAKALEKAGEHGDGHFIERTMALYEKLLT